MKTTLNKIREHNPCKGGWEKLLTYLGKTKADDEPLAITTILDSNGFNDALWCLRAVEGYDKEISLYAVWCARQVQHLLTDQRSLDALDVAERYANGEATEEELNAARAAAWDAARAAAWDAARAAAWATAWSAAEAARDAAREAARFAADAAGYAARFAAWNAAWDARDAARSVARAAEDAAWNAAGYAADATRAKQAAELRRICGEG